MKIFLTFLILALTNVYGQKNNSSYQHEFVGGLKKIAGDNYYKNIDETFAKVLATKYEVTNIRKGPGNAYPIKYIIILQNYPLKELLVYGDWIKVVDFEGEDGWVYKNLVSSKIKTVIVLKNDFIYAKPTDRSKKIASIGEHNVLFVLGEDEDYLLIKINGIEGWVKKEIVWGNTNPKINSKKK